MHCFKYSNFKLKSKTNIRPAKLPIFAWGEHFFTYYCCLFCVAFTAAALIDLTSRSASDIGRNEMELGGHNTPWYKHLQHTNVTITHYINMSIIKLITELMILKLWFQAFYYLIKFCQIERISMIYILYHRNITCQISKVVSIL